ncbi:MAG TPA: hypothetical protein VMW89_08725 [Desulfatiglandales bacterium]|nr:hypothetical protein [Desulfatiglandales bacterium]
MAHLLALVSIICWLVRESSVLRKCTHLVVLFNREKAWITV